MPVTLCFHQRNKHKIWKTEYRSEPISQRVELQIQDYEDNAGDPLTLCRQCVDYLQEALGELKAFVVAYRFASPEEEIHFFKAQKPHLVSKIIYYNTVYQTELRFPSGSVEVQKAYLRSEIERISAFFQKADKRILPEKPELLPILPHESHLSGQQVFPTWQT